MRAFLSLVGRISICTIFLMSAAGNKIPNFSAVAVIMEEKGVPMPQLMLVGAIVFLIAGSVSVMVGCYARLGALLLAALVWLLRAVRIWGCSRWPAGFWCWCLHLGLWWHSSRRWFCRPRHRRLQL